MNKKQLVNLSLTVSIGIFLGCGGSDNTGTTTTNPITSTKTNPKGITSQSIPNYTTNLLGASSLIQTAMNANSIQYVDSDFFKSLETKGTTTTYSSTVTAVPTLIDSSHGYSFIITKLNNNTTVEGAYAWQKNTNTYSLASRTLSVNDPNINSFEYVNDLTNDLKISSNLLNGLSNFLGANTLKVNSTTQFRDSNVYFSNVRATRGTINLPINDFNVPSDGRGYLLFILNIYQGFLVNGIIN